MYVCVCVCVWWGARCSVAVGALFYKLEGRRLETL
jgi:hypothetical protein